MSSSDTTVASPARDGAASTDPAASLTGLIGVLERADRSPFLQRTGPVHTSAFRASVRSVPLRSVQLAPVVRSGRVPAVPVTRTPTVTVVPDPERRPITGLRDLARRAALWGGGSDGEYLAWPTPEPTSRVVLRPSLRALTRRIALWGAGPRGEYLSWGRPAPLPASRPADPPVVLRELPSTPTVRPAASSPAVALIPAPTVPSPPRRPTVLRVTAIAPVVAAVRRAPMSPVGPGYAPPPPGWPHPPTWRAPRSAAAAAVRLPGAAPTSSSVGRTTPTARSPSRVPRAGPAGARGDPSSCPVRGSPRSLCPASTAPG